MGPRCCSLVYEFTQACYLVYAKLYLSAQAGGGKDDLGVGTTGALSRIINLSLEQTGIA